jgi:hypothetical protein
MKLLIKGNSLRFRLIRSELARFVETGRLEETIYFSLDGSSRFTYSLGHERSSEVAVLKCRTGETSIPQSPQRFETLVQTDSMGFYIEIHLGVCRSLELLIEKDLTCLDPIEGVGGDRFLNPPDLMDERGLQASGPTFL